MAIAVNVGPGTVARARGGEVGIRDGGRYRFGTGAGIRNGGRAGPFRRYPSDRPSPLVNVVVVVVAGRGTNKQAEKTRFPVGSIRTERGESRAGRAAAGRSPHINFGAGGSMNPEREPSSTADDRSGRAARTPVPPPMSHGFFFLFLSFSFSGLAPGARHRGEGTLAARARKCGEETTRSNF